MRLLECVDFCFRVIAFTFTEIAIAEAVVSVCRTTLKWGGLAGIAYFVFRTVETLAVAV